MFIFNEICNMKINDLPIKELLPGFVGKFLHTENNTITFWEIAQGASIPMHQHVHEQVTQITEGKFEMTIGNETMILEPGAIMVIPSNVPHCGTALTPCKILDVFSPVREDYRF